MLLHGALLRDVREVHPGDARRERAPGKHEARERASRGGAAASARPARERSRDRRQGRRGSGEVTEIEEKDTITATEREADLPIPDILPVLPLKDVVVFSYIILLLSVSWAQSINAMDAVLADQR